MTIKRKLVLFNLWNPFIFCTTFGILHSLFYKQRTWGLKTGRQTFILYTPSVCLTKYRVFETVWSLSLIRTWGSKEAFWFNKPLWSLLWSHHLLSIKSSLSDPRKEWRVYINSAFGSFLSINCNCVLKIFVRIQSIHMADALLLPDSGNKTHITVCYVFECVFKELSNEYGAASASILLMLPAIQVLLLDMQPLCLISVKLFFFFLASRSPSMVLASSRVLWVLGCWLCTFESSVVTSASWENRVFPRWLILLTVS